MTKVNTEVIMFDSFRCSHPTLKVAAIAAAGFFAAACQVIPDGQSVASYCAAGEHADKDVCKINVEIDGQKRALADTNLSLKQAEALAAEALATAGTAQQTAEAAMTREDNLYCETRTLNRTNVGSCSPGYKVMSCTQTRYTYRAGGTSILREIDDNQCRFNDRVLEMRVRCCMAGAGPSPVEAQADDAETPATPGSTS